MFSLSMEFLSGCYIVPRTILDKGNVWVCFHQWFPLLSADITDSNGNYWGGNHPWSIIFWINIGIWTIRIFHFKCPGSCMFIDSFMYLPNYFTHYYHACFKLWDDRLLGCTLIKPFHPSFAAELSWLLRLSSSA